MATAAVRGAARYFVGSDAEGGHCVFMFDTEGYTSKVQSYRTFEAARKSAERWQIRENDAVAKAASKAGR
jgi:hypothetical protein